MVSCSRKFHEKVSYAVLETLKQSRGKELNSKYFLYFITAIEFIQITTTIIITPLPDDPASNAFDAAMLKIIDWSDYLHLFGKVLTDSASKLYTAVIIQTLLTCSFVSLALTTDSGRTRSSFYKNLLKVQGFLQLIYLPVFFIPNFKICLHSLINDRSSLPVTILGGICLIWPLIYAFIVELRYSLNTDFFVTNYNQKRIGLFSVLFILFKAALVILNRALASDSSSDYSGVMYGFNLAAAITLLILYFREMSIYKRNFANFYLICMTSWIALATFAYLKLYQGVNGAVFLAVVMAAVAGVSVYKYHEWKIDHLVIKTDPHKLSNTLFDFVTREIFQIFKRAESGYLPSNFYLMTFIQHYFSDKDKNTLQRQAFREELIAECERYELQLRKTHNKDNEAMTSLKAVFFIVLDHMFTKRLGRSRDKLTAFIIVGYASFAVHHQKDGIKASKTLITHFGRASAESSLLTAFVVASLNREIKALIQSKYNTPMVKEVSYVAAIEYNEGLQATRNLLIDTLKNYEGFFSLLLNKTINLDQVYKAGMDLIQQKARLEKLFKELLGLNQYDKEIFFLISTYNTFEVTINRIEELKIAETRMLEHNSKGLKVLNEELSKKINIFTQGTGVIFISLYEKSLGKILSSSSGAVKLFGYNESDLKYLQLESIQPVCIAECHKDILMNRIASTKRMARALVLPAVDKERFVVPITLVLKFEYLAQELCAAGFIYRKIVPQDWLIVNRHGYLINYTEGFHTKLGLQQFKEKRPLYGLSVSTFIPKFYDHFFGKIMATDSEAERDDHVEGTEHFNIELKKSETSYESYLFLPDLSTRMQEMENLFRDLCKQYNPLAPSKNTEEDGYRHLELFLNTAEPFVYQSSPKNLFLYKIELSVDKVERRYDNGAHLKYFNVSVNSLVLEKDPAAVRTQLLSYHTLLQRARAALRKHKVDAANLRRSRDGNIWRSHASSDTATRRMNLFPVFGSSDESNSSAEHQIQTETMKNEQIEATIREDSKEASEHDVEISPRKVKFSEENNQKDEIQASEARIDEDCLSEDDEGANLDARLEFLKKMSEGNELFSQESEEKPKTLRFDPQFRLQLTPIQEEEEKHLVELTNLRRGKNGPLQRLFTTTGEVEKVSSQETQNIRITSEVAEIQTQRSDANLLGTSGMVHYVTFPLLQEAERKKEDPRLKSSQTEIPTRNATQNKEKQKLASLSKESQEIPSSVNEDEKLQKEILKLNQKTRSVHELQSQSTSHTSTASKIAHLRQIIFNQSTPSFLIKFNIFGLLAFGVLLLLISLLFFFLYQLLVQYSSYLAIADYSNFMLTPFSFFFVEAERLLLLNSGLLDQAGYSREQGYAETRANLLYQFQVYKTKYEQTAMVTNIELVSSTFVYSDLAFDIYEPNPDGSVDTLRNFSYTEATVRLLGYMDRFANDNYLDVTNLTNYIVYFRQNYQGYFNAFLKATGILFQDLYGEYRAIDVDTFSQASLGISLTILFLAMAFIYPLYRRNESVQIKILSLLGTFPSKDLETRILKFKLVHALLANHRIESMAAASQKFYEKNARERKRVTSEYVKKRANPVLFIGVLLLMYGAISVYFITDSIRVKSESSRFVPLTSEFDMSTDVYSFIPALLGMTYSEMNLYLFGGDFQKVNQTVSSFAASKEVFKARVAQLDDHFDQIDKFISRSIVTEDYIDLLYKLRGGNICDLAAQFTSMVNQTETDACKLLANGASGWGIPAIFEAYYDQMVVFTNLLETKGFTANNTLELVKSKEFLDYYRLAGETDKTLQLWVESQHINSSAAIDLQKLHAIESFVGGLVMLFGLYLVIWRTFVKRMKMQFVNTKSLFSLVPSDLLMESKLIKKFLSDQHRGMN